MSWGVLIAKPADAPRMARDTKRATVMSVENIFSDLYKEKARRRGKGVLGWWRENGLKADCCHMDANKYIKIKDCQKNCYYYVSSKGPTIHTL